MADDETVSISALNMDRGLPLGNSLDTFSRRALHTKVANLSTEPIPVYVTSSIVPPESEILDFNAINSVPGSTPTTLYTYLVSPTQVLYIHRIMLSGDTVAQFDFFIDGVLKARKRSYWGMPNPTFEFLADPDERGVKINSSSTILVQVTHFRPDNGGFEATLQGVLVG